MNEQYKNDAHIISKLFTHLASITSGKMTFNWEHNETFFCVNIRATPDAENIVSLYKKLKKALPSYKIKLVINRKHGAYLRVEHVELKSFTETLKSAFPQAYAITISAEWADGNHANTFMSAPVKRTMYLH